MVSGQWLQTVCISCQGEFAVEQCGLSVLASGSVEEWLNWIEVVNNI